MRTPVIVRRSNTDNCISTDDSSNFMNSPSRIVAEKSSSEKRLRNLFQKSNFFNFDNVPWNTQYSSFKEGKEVCRIDNIPLFGLRRNVQDKKLKYNVFKKENKVFHEF